MTEPKETGFPEAIVMRYVVGQFDFLANLVEMGGQTCEKVETAGHGFKCKRHGWPWTDAKPCPHTYTISRGELVGHLRTLRDELEDFLSISGGPDR